MNCLVPVITPLRLPPRNLAPLLQACQAFELFPGSRTTQTQLRTKSIWASPSRRKCYDYGLREGSSLLGCTRYLSSKRKPSPPKPLIPKSQAQKPSAQSSLHVIRDFENLPRTYVDADGLAYRNVPLTKKEALEIFGADIHLQFANRLLRRLHGRRVAGTLDDPSMLESGTDYEKVAQARALEWLREHVPVDEIKNAGLRAEKELSEMDEEVLRDAERIGIYTPNSQDVSEKPGGVYGQGVFEKMRLDAKEKMDKLEAEKKSQADEIRHNTGTLTTMDANSDARALARADAEAKLNYWRDRAMISQEQVVPKMSAFSRLWPSALVMVATCGFAYLLATVYEPPKTNGDRLWPSVPASAATIIGLIAFNTALFCMWRIPPCWRFMNTYFLQVPAYPYAFSLLGSLFSHQGLSHLALNMTVLYFVGTRLHEEVGRGTFLAVFLSAGAFGSMASLTARVLTSSFITSTLGSSGAIAGVIGCYLLLHSEEKVTLFGVFPPEDWPSISSLTLLCLLLGGEIVALIRPRLIPSNVDRWVHIGGFVSGMGSALLIRDQVRMRKEREAERRRNMGFMERITNKKP